MHLIPKGQNEWRNLLPNLCRAYIVLAYAIWKSISVFICGESSPFIPPVALTVGYLFCILVLAFVAGRQVERKENKSAIWTFIFVMVAMAFCLMNFPGSPAFRAVIFWSELLASGLVLCYVWKARRFQRTRALTFWIWGGAINIVRETGLLLCNYWTPPLGNAGYVGRTDFWGLMYYFPASSFLEFYWLGFLLTGVLYVAGLVLICQRLQSKEEFKPSPNTAMYVALGFLALMILMAVSFMGLRHAELLPTVAVNLAVLYFCFLGHQKFRMNAFAFLAMAAILTLVRVVGLVALDWYHNRLHNGGIYAVEQWLIQMMLLGSVLAMVFWGMGIILIIRRLQDQSVRAV